MRMTRGRGVVIGAGISGLAAGIAFALRGQQVQIFEARDVLVEADHLLWIAPNGLSAMERLGILDEVMRVATPQDIMGFTSAHLRPLMSLMGDDLTARLKRPIVAVRRTDLMQVLLRRLYALGGDIKFGYEVTHISDDLGEVTVSFANGVQSRADFVIGADGMGSRVPMRESGIRGYARGWVTVMCLVPANILARPTSFGG
jgi:salicylate hydroxylase